MKRSAGYYELIALFIVGQRSEGVNRPRVVMVYARKWYARFGDNVRSRVIRIVRLALLSARLAETRTGTQSNT